MGKHYALAREAILAALTAYTGITTADGATPANNTLICSDLINKNDFISGKTVLIGSGDALYEDKGAASFEETDGTITVESPFSAQIKAGIVFRILIVAAGQLAELLDSLVSYRGTTTAGGAAGGGTLVCSDLTTKPDFNGNQVVIKSGTYAGQVRDIDGDTRLLGGTVTPHTSFGGTITEGTRFSISAIRTVPVEVAALTTMVETDQYQDRIFYDEDAGIAGTAWPTGTPQVPSDVIADIITMCVARNLHKIQVHGALTLGDTMEHYCFFGSEHQEITDFVSLNGQDVDASHIEGLIVTGAQGGAGFLTLIRCTVNALTLFAGRMHYCSFFTSTSSFRDASWIDLIDCESISGVVTITVQAPTRASIKNWRGNLTLTAQDGGTCLVRGFKGTLVIDAMTAGTLNIYANGADITINANCSGGTINIYGNATITDNSGAGCTVTNYTLDTNLATIDLWSSITSQIVATTVPGNKALPSIVIAGIPSGVSISHALMFFKFRLVENINAAVNSVSGAQNIQAQKAVGGAWITGIALAGGEISVPANTRESGDVIMGTTDIKAQVPANGATISFQWTTALAAQNDLNFNDIQIGLRLYF